MKRQSQTPPDNTSLQRIAVEYAMRLHAPVIPCNAEKQTRTKGFPTLTVEQSISPSKLKRFGEVFLDMRFDGIGVVLGHGEKRLATIDGDDEEFWFELLHLNPRLANESLVSGGSLVGGNIWVRIIGEHPPFAVLRRGGKTGNKIGEWRCGSRCYTTIHGPHAKSGGAYRENGKAPVEIAFSDIVWPKGTYPFDPLIEDAQTEEDRIDTDDVIEGVSAFCPQVIVSLQEAVALCTPTGPHQTDDMMFKFTRALLNYELHLGRRLTEAELELAFALWYDAAKPHLRPKQSRDRYYMEFLNRYRRAKYPLAKSGAVKRAIDRAKTSAPPKEAERFTDPILRFLVSLLYYLQLESGDSAFFLSARDAGKILGVNKDTANKWLRNFEAPPFNFIRVVEKKTARRAPRLRWTGRWPSTLIMTPVSVS